MGNSRFRPSRGRTSATGVFSRGCVETKGLKLAPHTGHVSNFSPVLGRFRAAGKPAAAGGRHPFARNGGPPCLIPAPNDSAQSCTQHRNERAPRPRRFRTFHSIETIRKWTESSRATLAALVSRRKSRGHSRRASIRANSLRTAAQRQSIETGNLNVGSVPYNSMC
jgi:hypothetical protein